MQREIDQHSKQHKDKVNQFDDMNSQIEKTQISYLKNMRTLEEKLKQTG